MVCKSISGDFVHVRAFGKRHALRQRRKGQDHVQIVAEAIQEVIVQVHRVPRGRVALFLPLQT